MPPSDPHRGETRVELHDDVVVKLQPPALARLEAERTRRGAAVAARCGAFSVPAIVDADLAAGRLVFERVRDITPVRDHLAAADRDTLLDRVAGVLCTIHRDLAPGPAEVGSAPAVDGRAPPVWLHGDFSTTNVQVQRGTGALWVIDWAAPGWLPADLGRGAPSFDLAAFLLPLFWQRPGDPKPVPRPEAAAHRFLHAWAAGTGQPLRPVTDHVLRLQRLRLPFAAARVSRAGALARAPMQLRCARWLRAEGRAAARDEWRPPPTRRDRDAR